MCHDAKRHSVNPGCNQSGIIQSVRHSIDSAFNQLGIQSARYMYADLPGSVQLWPAKSQIGQVYSVMKQAPSGKAGQQGRKEALQLLDLWLPRRLLSTLFLYYRTATLPSFDSFARCGKWQYGNDDCDRRRSSELAPSGDRRLLEAIGLPDGRLNHYCRLGRR